MSTSYALFALSAAATHVLAWLGVEVAATPRAAPAVFVAHAVAGAVALVTGALQLSARLREGSWPRHRALGRLYVVAVWVASASGLWSALSFDVGAVSRALFVLAAVLWFAATTVAFAQIRRRLVAGHRAWMLRSFALALFFVTFEPWVAGLGASGVPRSLAYPVGLFLAWSVNLCVAEAWVRHGRLSRGRPGPLDGLADRG